MNLMTDRGARIARQYTAKGLVVHVMLCPFFWGGQREVIASIAPGGRTGRPRRFSGSAGVCGLQRAFGVGCESRRDLPRWPRRVVDDVVERAAGSRNVLHVLPHDLALRAGPARAPRSPE